MTKALAVIASLSAVLATYSLLRREPAETSGFKPAVAAGLEITKADAPESSVESAATVNADAADLYAEALAEARRRNKNVILVFDGPSCAWCKVLKEFLTRQADFFDRDYVMVHIEMSRMEHAKRVKDKFTDDPSVPWMVIVNPAGEVLGTSVGDTGNFGFPTAVADRRRFMSMIEQSAIRSGRAEIARLAQALDDFAEPLRLAVEDKEQAARLELAPEPWTGEWINVAADNPDMTRLIVSWDDEKLSIRAFAKCEPTDCDWGTTELRLCRVVGGESEVVAFARWDHGFQEAFVVLRMRNGQLATESFSIYKDESGRDCFVTSEMFERTKE